MPGVIMLGALLTLFCIELWMNSKTGGHDHGGATGQDLFKKSQDNSISWPKENEIMSKKKDIDEPWENERQVYKSREYTSPKDFDRSYVNTQSEMPAWFIAFYEQYIREREWTQNMLQSHIIRDPPANRKSEPEPTQSSHMDLEAGVDPEVLRKMSLNITILEGGILFHSVFVGMTVSIESEGFIVLLIAILFHQAFEGLGLGSRIAAVPYPKKSIRPWVLALAFGTTAPIGQAIGLVARTIYDPASAFALIMVGSFNAISSGLLIYAALVDLLAEDFLSHEGLKLSKRQKISGVSFIFLGAIGMSVVGAFA
ncbi:hypothetical protein FQN50_003508 [Emmonsiellopsis sp. PD_5]|nr:hypothetical protein FQN50_003508 [Emmonsiellopsis sp. PD_5]